MAKPTKQKIAALGTCLNMLKANGLSAMDLYAYATAIDVVATIDELKTENPDEFGRSYTAKDELENCRDAELDDPSDVIWDLWNLAETYLPAAERAYKERRHG